MPRVVLVALVAVITLAHLSHANYGYGNPYGAAPFRSGPQAPQAAPPQPQFDAETLIPARTVPKGSLSSQGEPAAEQQQQQQAQLEEQAKAHAQGRVFSSHPAFNQQQQQQQQQGQHHQPYGSDPSSFRKHQHGAHAYVNPQVLQHHLLLQQQQQQQQHAAAAAAYQFYPQAFHKPAEDSSSSSSSSSTDGTAPAAPQVGYRHGQFAYEKLVAGGVAASPKQRRFLDWLFNSGFAMDEEKPPVVLAADEHGPYLRITRELNASELLFSVPVAVHLYSNSPRLSQVTRSALDFFRHQMLIPGWHLEDFTLTELALAVYFERKNPYGFFGPYLDTLPVPACPVFFHDSEMAAAQSPLLESMRSHYVEKGYSNFLTLLRMPGFVHHFLPHFVGERHEAEEFLFALATVIQRAFSWGPEDRQDFALVPFMDMAHHNLSAKNAYAYRLHELGAHAQRDIYHTTPPGHVRALSMLSATKLEAGSPLFISYNEKVTNMELMLQYGIVAPNNPSDFIVVEVTRQGEHAGQPPERFPIRGKRMMLPRGFVDRMMEIGAVSSLSKAFRLVAEAVAHEEASFKTTFKHDKDLVADDEGWAALTPNMRSAVLFRVTVKSFLRNCRLAMMGEALRTEDAAISQFDPNPPSDLRFALHVVPIRL